MKSSNKSSIIFIVLFLSLVFVVYKNYFEVTNENYHKYFYKSIADGDVSSNQCLNAWEKYRENKNGLYFDDRTITSDYIYDYKKKRCLLKEDVNFKNNGEGTKGNETISDLITSKELYFYSIETVDGVTTFYTKDFINNKTWNTFKSPGFMYYKLKQISQ